MPFLIIRDDITRLSVDAIVNAANNTLLGGGGVDGAIHRAAGPELLEECRGLGGCETGCAKSTSAYRLPCRYVIHTVGPVWHGGGHNERELLASCYRNSLLEAERLGCESVAFPLISSGAYGYPKREAAEVAINAIREFLEDHEMSVILTLFGRADIVASRELIGEVEAYIDDKYVELHTDSVEAQKRRQWYLLGSLAKESALERPAAAAKPRADDLPNAAPTLQCEVYMPMEDMAYADREEDIGDRFGDLDESFSQNLLRRITASGMTDAECYKRANIDRKLFSKIRSDPYYRPSKPTAIAFAIALRLSLEATNDLLRRAGFILSRSFKFDVIIEYFIVHGIYDIYEINETLFAYDQPLLGC